MANVANQMKAIEGGPIFRICTELGIRGDTFAWNPVFQIEITYRQSDVLIRVGETSETISVSLAQSGELDRNELDEFLEHLTDRTLNEIKTSPVNGLSERTYIDYPAN